MVGGAPARGAEAEPAPLGRAALAARFREIGVERGRVLLVQASLSRLGPVEGGADTVVAALLDALDGGTLVAYTSTPENSLTSRLFRSVSAGWSRERIEAWRADRPPFDPGTTPASPTMGVLSERIRRHPGARRSDHPQCSFAAVGELAAEVVRVHDRDCHLGERSPLGRLYELDARVLSIGVGFDRFTGFHLADLRMPDVAVRHYSCKVRTADGGAEWVSFDGPYLDDTHFGRLGEEVQAEARGIVRARIGGAECRLVPLVESVDVAERVLRRWRGLP
ncbi:aminoglycoside N(3)-acetyltransferase [Kitasatospora sp. NPDC004240]